MRIIIIIAGVVLAFARCSTSRKAVVAGNTNATINKEGFIDCFEKKLSVNGRPVWCEASGIVYDGTKMFFASDKEMPGERSAVFYWMVKDGFADTTKPASYLTNALLKKAIKYEDFALTPNGKYIFLSTGFDRIKPGSNEWDSYNTLVFWKAGSETFPQIISINGMDSTSVSYREKITQLLATDSFPKGMPYFKIEGIAADQNTLYWGIREEGKKYDNFKYKVKIITTSYKIQEGRVQLGNEFKILADIDMKAIAPNLPERMGLSSIEYDPYNKRFLVLTSFENGEELGGYLWTATLSELKSNKMIPVKRPDGNLLKFTHKPEDITVINKNKVIIIHDDDRVRTKVMEIVRQENQAAYSIVLFN